MTNAVIETVTFGPEASRIESTTVVCGGARAELEIAKHDASRSENRIRRTGKTVVRWSVRKNEGSLWRTYKATFATVEAARAFAAAKLPVIVKWAEGALA